MTEDGSKKDESYLAVMREVVSTKIERGTLYTQEPKDVAPVEALEGVLMYKATRAFYSSDNKKKRDELIDIINYAAFIIARIDMYEKAAPVIRKSIEQARSKTTEIKK
jgi:hypothetical protein